MKCSGPTVDNVAAVAKVVCRTIYVNKTMKMGAKIPSQMFLVKEGSPT